MNPDFFKLNWQERVKLAATEPIESGDIELYLNDCADVIVSILLRTDVQLTEIQKSKCLTHEDPWVRVALLKRKDVFISDRHLEQCKKSMYKLEQQAAIDKQRSQQ